VTVIESNEQCDIKFHIGEPVTPGWWGGVGKGDCVAVVVVVLTDRREGGNS